MATGDPHVWDGWCWCGLYHERVWRSSTKEELIDLLRPYIYHKPWCLKSDYDMNDVAPSCSCGLDTILKREE